MTSGNGPWGTLSYTYDIVGNRLSEVVNGTGTTYTIGAYNKLMSAGSVSFTYDNNGNRITKTDGSNSWSYTYDFENRLRQVKLNAQSVFQAWYDGDGRRIKTTEANTTSVFHYRAGSWDPVYVKDLGSGVVTDVVFAGALRIGKVESGVSYYYHLDHLGSVRRVTNSLVTSTFTAKYRPFGTSYATSGSEPFRYTGKQLDSSTGLQYYGYRYYDSQAGRFISADQAPPELMNPQTINQYTYALDNPNLYVDLDGRLPIAVLVVAVIALIILNIALHYLIKYWPEISEVLMEVVGEYIAKTFPPPPPSECGPDCTTVTYTRSTHATTTTIQTVTYNTQRTITATTTWITTTTSSGKVTISPTVITISTPEGSATYKLTRRSILIWIKTPDGYEPFITEEYQA